MVILRWVRQRIRGSEIKHTGDGIMASFATASSALDCGIAMQRAFAVEGDRPLDVRDGEVRSRVDDADGVRQAHARQTCGAVPVTKSLSA